LAYVAGLAGSHYADILFDALDAVVKKQFRKFNLSINRGEEGVYRDVERDDREKAIGMIREALEELEQKEKERGRRVPPPPSE
jgi:hypothetical protein